MQRTSHLFLSGRVNSLLLLVMETTFLTAHPACLCLAVPELPRNFMYSRNSGFGLFLGENVNQYVTDAFCPFGSEIMIKLKIRQRSNSSNAEPAIQILLVEPQDDIISLMVNDTPAFLTGTADSFVSYKSDGALDHGMNSSAMKKYMFSMLLPDGIQWRTGFRNLDLPEPNVTLRMGEVELMTRRELLIAHSDVFRAMFEHDLKEKQTSVVEINDFSFEIVKEMIRFMMHGTCALWHKHHEDLAAIADKYQIEGMKQLAVTKKQWIDELF